MENRTALTFNPVPHPDRFVRQVGFELSDPYVEQCWGPVLGPSATVLLRRLPALWEQRTPASVSHGELSRSLGLGEGSGANSRLTHTLERLTRFGFAAWDRDTNTLDVFAQVPGLDRHQLAKLPQWTRDTHEQLFATHISAIQSRESMAPKVATITARLDRLQNPRSIETASLTRPGRGIER